MYYMYDMSRPSLLVQLCEDVEAPNISKVLYILVLVRHNRIHLQGINWLIINLKTELVL